MMLKHLETSYETIHAAGSQRKYHNTLRADIHLCLARIQNCTSLQVAIAGESEGVTAPVVPMRCQSRITFWRL
jgi:hypothetical protein